MYLRAAAAAAAAATAAAAAAEAAVAAAAADNANASASLNLHIASANAAHANVANTAAAAAALASSQVAEAAAAAGLTAAAALVHVARRVVARWRAFVEGRQGRPLLDVLHTDLFAKEVLERLDPTSCTLFARVGKSFRAAVLASGLPRLPRGVRARVRVQVRVVEDICMSVERLAWAKANACRWSSEVCAHAAKGGRLYVLCWAREHDCPWDALTCWRAAGGGHLEVFKWTWEHGCPCPNLPRLRRRVPKHIAAYISTVL
jgi:hypothetical protein